MNSLYKNSALYLVSNVAVRATSFLLVPFYSYLVSPREYGYVYIVISFVTFLSLFVTCSLHGAVNRFYFECNNNDDVCRMYSTISAMVLITSTIVTFSLLIFSLRLAYLLNIPVVYLRIAIFTSVFNSFYRLITELLYVKQEAKIISITSIGVGAAQIIIQLCMVLLMDDKAMAMVQSQFICGVIMLLIYFVFSRSYLRWEFDIRGAWTYFKYSLCQVPSDVSVWFLQFSDRIMINKIKGSALTGIYGMGQTLGNIPKVAYFSINKAYVPFVLSSYKEIDRGNEDKKEQLKKHTTLVFTLVTIIVTLIIVFSNNIVSLLDKRYADAVIVMVVMLFAMLIDCYRTMFMNPLSYNIKYIKVSSAIWTSMAIVNIGLNAFLIPKFSIYGACFSMTVSYLLTFLLIVYFARKAYYVEYDIKSMVHVFLLSQVVCLCFLIGSSVLLLPIKIIVIFIYICVLAKILHISIREFIVQNIILLKKKLKNK